MALMQPYRWGADGENLITGTLCWEYGCGPVAGEMSPAPGAMVDRAVVDAPVPSVPPVFEPPDEGMEAALVLLLILPTLAAGGYSP